MRRWLVGGAVRDALLGLPVQDRDWLVTGADAATLLAAGFVPVGKDFPIFLDPEHHEEHALPRPAPVGLRIPSGFPEPALYGDLAARDLTINAMARDEQGQLIDPFGGRDDLAQRRLRHVSDAFGDDPARILRVARLHARYAPLGFVIASETQALMRALAPRLAEIDGERLWSEIQRALREPEAARFFEDLRACGALAVVMPELDALFGVPQPPRYHPEIDTGVHSLLALRRARELSDDPRIAFAALTHDLGKALTDPERWPSHHGHEALGQAPLEALCQRLRVPKAWRRLAVATCRNHTHCHRIAELRPRTLLTVLEALDGFRQPDNVERFALACQADAQGRTGLENRPYPQAGILRAAHRAARAVATRPLVEACLQGDAFRARLRRERVRAIAESKRQNQ